MSNPTYDAAIFADTMSEQPAFDPVIDARTILDIRDSNNGSYTSNDVVFDAREAGAGSDLFAALGESTVLVPFNLSMAATGGRFVPVSSNKYAMCLKNCVNQLVNALTLNINGTEVVSRRENLGMLSTYLLMNRMTPADIAASGPSYGFAMDSPDSIAWNNALGEVNNVIVEADRSPAIPQPSNKGRFDRAKWACTSEEAAYAAFQDLATAKQNCHRSSAATSSDTTITQELIVCIPLKSLHPIFESLPLLCKSHIQLTLNMNVCNTNFTVLNGAITGQTTNQPNRVCPYTVSPPSVGASNGLRVDADVTGLNVTMSIGNTMLNQCILRMHRYRLSPDSLSKLIDRGPYTVRYDDFYSRIIQNVNVLNNEHISAPVQRPRRLIVIPQTTRSANGTAGIAPAASALTSAPATCQPYWQCHQLQCTMSGESIYSAPLSYTYNQWLSEIAYSGSMNGGFTDNLKSGLITEYDWRTAYGALDINLSRHTKGNDDPATQVALSLTNQHRFNSDYYTFLIYEREFTISPVTGELTK